ncbi:hypothetical protein [Algicella marina]|uniref:Uncharacterized protein n=1 Tax=Algicella marina TaxID=2683284 RepID=A0A6P1T221_9RHOB|nr:hypothetical protein [Algicella marina]QHQ35840.1 hypothetical protein GO499_11985 [Algicella marina]
MSERAERMIWVKVDRPAALGHAKGRLGWALWLIVVFLTLRAAWFAQVALAFDGGIALWGQVGLMLVLVTMLVLRVPLAFPLMILHGAVVLIWFVRGLGEGQEVAALVDLGLHVPVLFYMVEGLRPNLIYRHRFRAYRGGEADAN